MAQKLDVKFLIVAVLEWLWRRLVSGVGSGGWLKSALAVSVISVRKGRKSRKESGEE